MRNRLAALLAVSVWMLGSGQTPATAADYLGRDATVYGPTGACGNTAVLGFITTRFVERASAYLKSDIEIADIHDVRQSRLLPRDETHPVEREYCRATAVTTDGEHRSLWYLIERNWAFAGMGSSIEYCLSGLDPWYVYGAHCASLR